MNGSPIKPSWHIQFGVWFITLQYALIPQDPGHGSWHFSRIHAKLLRQSLFNTHSGLQFGGLPKYCDKHEHDGTPPLSLHSEYRPHGDGTHGFV